MSKQRKIKIGTHKIAKNKTKHILFRTYSFDLTEKDTSENAKVKALKHIGIDNDEVHVHMEDRGLPLHP